MLPQNPETNSSDDSGLHSDDSPFGTLTPSSLGGPSSPGFAPPQRIRSKGQTVKNPAGLILYIGLILVGAGGVFYFALSQSGHDAGVRHYNAGLRAEKAGDKKGAIVEYSKSLETETDKSYKADAYIQRGLLYEQNDQVDKALADFNQAIDLDPKKDAPYYDRGQIYSDQGKYSEALQDFDKSAELNPKDNDVYYERALVYIREKKIGPAVSQAKILIGRGGKLRERAQNTLIDMLLERASMKTKTRNYSAALQDVNDVIFIEPNNADAYRQRAAIYTVLKDAEHARADLIKSHELGGKG